MREALSLGSPCRGGLLPGRGQPEATRLVAQDRDVGLGGDRPLIGWADPLQKMMRV